MINLKLPQRPEKETGYSKRFKLFQDYAKKLEKILDCGVYGFDPDFACQYKYKVIGYDGKFRYYTYECFSLTFLTAHMILKSHNLHDPSIEVK